MDYVRGKVYRRPAGEQAWCVEALDEIARTLLHPIRIALQMTDGANHVGHLDKVADGKVTLEMPREKQAVTLDGGEVIAFSLVPERLPDKGDEAQKT
jgi:hypothetical protein